MLVQRCFTQLMLAAAFFSVALNKACQYIFPSRGLWSVVFRHTDCGVTSNYLNVHEKVADLVNSRPSLIFITACSLTTTDLLLRNISIELGHYCIM